MEMSLYPDGLLSHPQQNKMMASSDYPDWMTAQHKTGKTTIIMAAEFDGGVVIGTDSSTTTGDDFANRVIVKLAPAQGSAAATQAIADRAKYHLNFLSIEMGRPLLVKTVANVFHNICYANRDDLTAGIICAGWDKSEGGQVFSIPLGGMCVRQPFAIEGSGSTYIYGHCDATFKRNMTKEECISFVARAVALATRYGSSGGIIRLAAIDETGIEKRNIQGEEMLETMNAEENSVNCPGVVTFDTGNRLGTAMTCDGSPDGIRDVATIDETEIEEGVTHGEEMLETMNAEENSENRLGTAMTFDGSPDGIRDVATIDETEIEEGVTHGYHPTSERIVEIRNEEGNYVECSGNVRFDTGNLLGTAISKKLVEHTVDRANRRCYTEEGRDCFGRTISMLKINIDLKIDERNFSLVAHCGITPKGTDLLIGMDIIEQLIA